MSNKTQISELSQNFLVNRDGTIDTEWLQARLKQERAEMLQECGRQAVRSIFSGVGAIGRGIIAIYDAIPTD